MAPSPLPARFLNLARYAVAAALLWLVWRRVGGIAFDGSALDLRWFLAALLAGGIVVAGWTTRWWLLLRAQNIGRSWKQCAVLTLRADFFNFFFLGPLGADGYRWLALQRDQKVPSSREAAFASVYLDHIIGLLGGVCLFGLLSWPRRAEFMAGGGLPATILTVTAWTMLALALLVLSGLIASWDPIFHRQVRSKRWFRPFDLLLRPFDTVRRRAVPHLAALAVSMLASLASHTAYWCAAKSLGAKVALPTLLAAMPVAEFAASIPVSVSGIGVREHLVVELLRFPLGGLAETALLVSLLGFAAHAFWGVIGGLSLLFKRRRPA